MKHQLFRKNTYVEIDTSIEHVTVIGQVEDSTISHQYLPKERVFNVPSESIKLKSKLLLLYENPEISPKLIDDIDFLKDITFDFSNMYIHDGYIYVSIEHIELPAQELKDMFYKLNQGAKSNQRY